MQILPISPLSAAGLKASQFGYAACAYLGREGQKPFGCDGSLGRRDGHELPASPPRRRLLDQGCRVRESRQLLTVAHWRLCGKNGAPKEYLNTYQAT